MLEVYKASYVSLLEDELHLRKKKNNLYSLRAFAQNLELSPAYISMVLSRKRHLSLKKAIYIAKKLKWNRQKQKYFVNLLEFENPQSESTRDLAAHNLNELGKNEIQFNALQVDTFAAISEWHYNAILALLSIKKSKNTITSISKKLGISSVETQTALWRLNRLGLIRVEKNDWMATQEFLRVKSTPSEAIKRYHKQLLSMASKALDEQAFELRDFSNITLTVDRSRMQEAKDRIVKFQNELAQILEGENPTEVYQFSMQLFGLSQRHGD